METLRARVARRRASGAYPPDLEHELDVHFRHIVEHRPFRNFDALKTAMRDFEAGLRFDARLIPTTSSVPGGEVLHRSLAKLTTRHTDWMVERMRDFAESVRVMLWKMIETLDAPTHVHGELTAQLDAVLDRLAVYEQYPADAPALGAIVARLEALEAAEAARSGPAGVQDPVRPVEPGPDAFDPQVIAARLHGQAPVLAVAAGSGATALAGRLAAAGVASEAVETAMSLDRLAGAPAATLGAVVVDGATDHDLVTSLVALAADRLRPGGALVLVSGPAAGRPLHPAHVTFILREGGFANVMVDQAEAGKGHAPYAVTATR